jgi:hypothetical protein
MVIDEMGEDIKKWRYSVILQHPASSIQHPASSIQHPAYGCRRFSLAPRAPTKFAIAAICAAFSTGCVTTQGHNPLQETFASDDPCSNNARNIGIVAGSIFGAIFEKEVRSRSRSWPRL